MLIKPFNIVIVAPPPLLGGGRGFFRSCSFPPRFGPSAVLGRSQTPPHGKPPFLVPGGGAGAPGPGVCKGGGEGGRNLLCCCNSATPRNFGVKFVRPAGWRLRSAPPRRERGGGQGANHPRGRPRQRGVEQ